MLEVPTLAAGWPALYHFVAYLDTAAAATWPCVPSSRP